jgi:hypothetical protein
MNEINIIHEINNKNKIIKTNEDEKNQLNYELQNNFFDPNSGSPPNYFISKLLTRIKNYETDKKLINLNKE